jgi:hypothetical protein
MRHHVKDSKIIGCLEVQVVWDEHPSHPDEGNDDAFLIALDHRNFYVPRSGWSEHSDFRGFIHPHHRETDDNELLSGPRLSRKPQRFDDEFKRVYLDYCMNDLEVLSCAAGEEPGYIDDNGMTAAYDNLQKREEVWEAWSDFDAAHGEWGCWAVDIRNYGGGCLGIALGDVYEGGETDRWGDPKEPDGYILVRKDVGWHHPVEEVAKSVLESWRKYIDGEIVGYRVVKVDEDGEELEEVEACWGFDDENYCMEEGVSVAEAAMEQMKAEEERKNGMRHSHHHREEAQEHLGSREPAAADRAAACPG